jgi:branched-chain amino acid aminotransferase
MSEFFSKNGQILPISEATISLLNIEYSYGYGVYETLKVRNRKIYFVDMHLERLEYSAKVIGIVIPFSKTDIKNFLNQLVNKIDAESCNLKILVIGGKETTLSIFASAPLFPDKKLYKTGASMISYTYERLFPTAKTLNMLPSYIAYKKAQEKNCYDALLIDKDGAILEGTRTNFCLLKGKTIFRAPIGKVLEGVTFLTLTDVARAAGFEVKEAEIHIHDLKNYDGAFLTSTSTKIMPVIQINDFKFAHISPELKELMAVYDTFLEKYVE